MGFRSGPGSTTLFSCSAQLADAQNVSLVRRKRIFLPVVPYLHRRYRVLDYLLFRRTSAQRRLTYSQFLGNGDLLVLFAAAGMRNMAGFQIRSENRSFVSREHHLSNGLLDASCSHIL